ncbi:molybdopterin molybdotransferase MoeA [Guyparkeria hydrothermalis]|uniref:molybdopterin molybdotransferase MoeA n=1 Tax=Guyparkeria hydrothermalis TaxID=923 RepID=UPI0020225D22|nr:molybdopterin molybdotransferase MoeA [Guyparkeria hydrothermalis]MCL7744441.1 molybdopterin molybdotransferase MoeA [Guyparkeria hydrothermalis]
MDTVDNVVARLRDWIQPLGDAEQVPVLESVGRVLAEPVTAPRDVPVAPLSLFDGYAGAGPLVAGESCPVVGKQFAGDPPATLEPGTAMRIFTGALLPEGADTVIAQESVEIDADRACWQADVSQGDGVRQTGADTREGERLLSAGTRVTAAMLGLLASTGQAKVTVGRRVRVALLTTGDELLAPGDPFAPGKIYDANGPMLEVLLAAAGVEIVQRAVLPDDRSEIDARLREAAEADLIVTSGGVSVGEADLVRAGVEALGRIDHWRIFLKPGKPLAIGEVLGTPFLGLPGNPVSTFVTYLRFVRTAIDRLAGQEDPGAWPTLPLPLASARTGGDRPEYIRVRRVEVDGRVMLDVYPDQNSGLLSSLAWADGLALIPPGARLAAGDTVEFTAFKELGL